MGYDLYITRSTDPLTSHDSPITAAEWLAVVATDQSLKLAPENGQYFTHWLTTLDSDEPWFNWRDGCIYTKNPSPACIDKMVEIAALLNAQVVGEEGEVYTADHRTMYTPRPLTVADTMLALWSYLLFGLIVGLVVLLGVILVAVVI